MRFIHSVWSRPALMGRWNTDDQLGKDIWSFALSAHYVKAHGHEIVLHTDGAGERLFGVLPYDDVFRSLDTLPTADVFWAAGKAEALRLEDTGAVHIDGDVFITSDEMFDLIARDDCDLVVQGDYECEALGRLRNILRPYLVRYVPSLFGNNNLTYSCGLVRFLNQDLKDEYITAYQRISGYLTRSISLIAMLQQDRNLTVDLLVEQKLLRVLAETSGVVVRKVVEDPAQETMRHVEVEGYEHVAFLNKYWELPRIQQTLREVNPELFARVEDHVGRFGQLPPPSTFHAVRTPGDGKGSGLADDARATATVTDRAARYAIVTPYFREGREQIERCVQSVRDQTLKADHFVVADGFPQEWLDSAGVRHLKLDRNHADCGNTPRGMGALLAVAEQYDAIGMLDVDNWLEPDHVESCLNAAATTAKRCDYVIARRVFHRPDGSLMEGLREEVYHVDTSCFFFLRGAFCVLPYWGTMPPQMSGVCDRVFYEMIRQWDFTVARVPQPTVHFTTIYLQHYELLGERPPPEVKHIDINEATRWLDSLTPQEGEIARRLAGYRAHATPANVPKRIPQLGATVPNGAAVIWERR